MNINTPQLMHECCKDPPNSILPEISMHWMESCSIHEWNPGSIHAAAPCLAQTYLTRLHIEKGKKKLSMAAVVTACRISIEYGFWKGKEKNFAYEQITPTHICTHTLFGWETQVGWWWGSKSGLALYHITIKRCGVLHQQFKWSLQFELSWEISPVC